MTAPTTPPAQPDPGEDCPAATSVGGLARDLEALRRDVTALSGLARRVEELGQLGTPPAKAHRHHGRARGPPARQDPAPPSANRASAGRAANDRRVVVNRARQPSTRTQR